MLLLLDNELLGHLALAVERYRRALERNGLCEPAGLEDLQWGLVEAAKSVTAGQGGSGGTSIPAVADTQPMPEWLTTSEVAAMTGMSISTVKRAIADGSLRSTKVGGRRRIRWTAVEEFMAAT